MDNKDSIDVEYTEVKNDCYITAPQIAQLIDSTDISVRYWADTFFDLLGLEKSNGRKKYKQSDVNKFAFLKELIEVKKFSHNQVRDHLSKHGFKYAEFDSGLINPKDPLGFQALASALSVEVDEKLSKFSEKIYGDIEELLKKYLVYQNDKSLEMRAEIEGSVGDIVSNALTKIESQQLEIKEHIAITLTETLDNSLDQKLDTKLEQATNNITQSITESISQEFKSHMDERELEYQKRMQIEMDKLAASLEATKKQYELEQQEKEKKKGFLGIIFGSKK